jgi:acetyl-CoA carboxylase biotin carboxyl carrier protein
MDLSRIEEVIKLLNQYGLQQIEVEDGDFKLKIASFNPVTNFAPMAQPFLHHLSHPGQMVAPPSSATQGRGHDAPEAPGQKVVKGREIRSPFVGTFYRSPGPGTEHFVEVGQRVKKGDTLCIVEAMKLMNEIESEVDGVIVSILINNEEPVEFDQPLFIID